MFTIMNFVDLLLSLGLFCAILIPLGAIGVMAGFRVPLGLRTRILAPTAALRAHLDPEARLIIYVALGAVLEILGYLWLNPASPYWFTFQNCVWFFPALLITALGSLDVVYQVEEDRYNLEATNGIWAADAEVFWSEWQEQEGGEHR